MDIAFFGQQNWDVCWTAKQQLATRLARRGHRVLYINPLGTSANPGNRLDALIPGRSDLGLQEFQENLWIYTYHAVPGLGRWYNGRRRPRVLGAIARRLGMTAPVALVSTPLQRWLKEGVNPVARVYYAVDEWTGFGGLTDEQKARLRAEEEACLRESDVALAVSPRLLERFQQLQPYSYLQENGVDLDHFSPARLEAAGVHPGLRDLPGPRLGFVGQVDERLDPDLLLYLARQRPDWSFVLAGRVKEGVDVSVLESAPNIRLLGYQPYTDLPSVLAGYDVCLVPYRVFELTQSCNPLKVYEYLATGRPVVATPLEGLNTCKDVVARAGTPEAFLEAVDAAVADPDAGRARRLEVAEECSWERRTDHLEERLEEALRRGYTKGNRRTFPLPGRSVGAYGFPLDAKDESERRMNGGFRRDRLTPLQTAAVLATHAAGCAYYALRLAGRTLTLRTAPVHRILVVRKSFLGDFIAFLPALEALRRRFPRARIVLATQPGMGAAALLEGTGLVDEVMPLDFMSNPSRIERLRGAAKLFARGFDLMIFGASYYLLREALFSGAPRRIGLYDGHPWQRIASRVLPLDPNRHEADNNLAVVDLLGGKIDEARPPEVRLSPEATKKGADELYATLGLAADARVVTVHPGGARPSRRWFPERFAELLVRLLEAHPDLHAVITGVPGERAQADAVLAALPPETSGRVHDAVGLTQLPGLVGLLDRSVLVVSNDTGVLHLARARNRPLLALLGPENDRRWGPYPLGGAPAIALRHVVPCAPCVRTECPGHYCLRLLTVDEAFESAERLLADVASGGTRELERRRRHHTWRGLAEAGFALPKVSVVVRAKGEARRRLLEALARQTYPNVEAIVVQSSDEGEAGSSETAGPPVRVVAVAEEQDIDDLWRAVSAVADGDFLLAAPESPSWPEGKIAADVAALYRTPRAIAADGLQLFGREASEELARQRLDSVTFRRELFARRPAPREPEHEWASAGCMAPDTSGEPR